MWKALTLFLVMSLVGAGYYLLTPGGRQLIDRVYINWTRAEYQARFRAGGKLPGTPDLAVSMSLTIFTSLELHLFLTSRRLRPMATAVRWLRRLQGLRRRSHVAAWRDTYCQIYRYGSAHTNLLGSVACPLDYGLANPYAEQ